eukprot:7318951-Pyramimonas_sp.AAC.1
MPPGLGWFPCPRTDRSPSALWTKSYCRLCDLHALVLRASRDMEAGEEITVGDSPLPAADAAQ